MGTKSPTLKPTTDPTLTSMKPDLDINSLSVPASNLPMIPNSGTIDVKSTAQPTKIDTLTPTVSTTQKPTIAPTSSPTNKPTLHPSTSSTAEPTYKPTVYPTITKDVKTPKSSIDPTSFPTSIPSKAPSLNPTVQPSRSLKVNNEEDNTGTLRINAIASFDDEENAEKSDTRTVSQEYDENMDDTDDNDINDDDTDASTPGLNNGLNNILLLSGTVIGSLCIMCSGFIFLTMCCCVGRKKRSDGLTDIE